MSRAAVLLPCLCVALALACSSSDEHGEHRGPEFHFGAAPEPGAPPTKKADEPAADGQHEAAIDVELPGVRADGSIVFAVDWFHGSVEQALAKAKAEGKLVFVDVGADWCPPCHELDEEVFTRPEVGEWLRERMIAVHVDAEKGEGPELVARYDVQAYPTMLVLEADGVEKDRVVDAMAPEELLAKLDAIAKGENVLAELEAAVAAAPDDLEARYRLGHAYALAARREDADSVFATIVAADPDNESGYTSKLFYDRAQFFTLKLDEDPEAAIAELQALQRKYPDSPEATRAYRMIGRAYCQLDRPAEAVASLEAMIASDPDDVDLKVSYGWFAFRQKCRPDAGLAAVLAGIEQDPKLPELRYLEAELRWLLGEREAGLAAARTASELEPDSAYYKRKLRSFEELARDAGE